MEQLTEKERRLIALALFSLAMKYGPPLFETIQQIVEKLGCQKEITFYARDFVKHNNPNDNTGPTQNQTT